ncbi:MAG: type II toxin-antitoxin system VapB family antitoxin [Nitrospirae bacterium]|nr:MAG: type II toxin-antitoxin system VapB family antitoxin [Nitrospirota bacterium]
MKMFVEIDETLLQEAMALSNASTKKETIRRTLAEFVRSCHRQSLKSLAGSGLSGHCLPA